MEYLVICFIVSKGFAFHFLPTFTIYKISVERWYCKSFIPNRNYQLYIISMKSTCCVPFRGCEQNIHFVPRLVYAENLFVSMFTININPEWIFEASHFARFWGVSWWLALLSVARSAGSLWSSRNTLPKPGTENSRHGLGGSLVPIF